MALTLSAVAEPNNVPPRVRLEAEESDATMPLQSCIFYRDGLPLRFSATITSSLALAYDYDAPFDVAMLYRADVVESTPVTLDWTDTFASLAAWTEIVAGWSAGAGVAAAVDTISGTEPTIRRAAAGTIARVTGTDPTVTLSAGTPTAPAGDGSHGSGWAAYLIYDLLDADGTIVAAVLFGRRRDHLGTNADEILLYTTLGTASTAHAPNSWDITVAADSITASGSGWTLTAPFVGTVTQVQTRAYVTDASGLDAPTATVATDDISVYLTAGTTTATDEDTETLDGEGIWLGNTTNPDLSLQLDDCADASIEYSLSDETRKTTRNASTSVALDIEGSNTTLTVVTGPRKAAEWTLEVICKTEVARKALDAVLADNAPISLRIAADHAHLGLDGGFYAVGDTASNREHGPVISERTTVSMPLTPAFAPAFDSLWQWNWDALAQTGLTWDEVAAMFPTWNDLLIGPVA